MRTFSFIKLKLFPSFVFKNFSEIDPCMGVSKITPNFQYFLKLLPICSFLVSQKPHVRGLHNTLTQRDTYLKLL